MATAKLPVARARGESLREARSILATSPMSSTELSRRMGLSVARACQLANNLSRKGEVVRSGSVWAVPGGKYDEVRPTELTKTARLKRSIEALLERDQIGTGEVARRLGLTPSWASRLLNEMWVEGRLEKKSRRIWRLVVAGGMEVVPGEDFAARGDVLAGKHVEHDVRSAGVRPSEWIDQRTGVVDVTITVRGGGR